VLIELREPGDRAVRQLVRELQAELADADGPGGYRPRGSVEFMLGLIDGRPVACGALQQVAPGIGEIDCMYVRPTWRRQGLSRLILAALEERAVEIGCHLLQLETTVGVGWAVRLYEGAGFHGVPGRAGDPRHACYEKSLLPTPAGDACGAGSSQRSIGLNGSAGAGAAVRPGQCGAATVSACWSCTA
jgi:putative acetyltransferase